MPGNFRWTRGDYARVLFYFAREAAGALGARHSPRPRGRKELHNSGAYAPRECGVVFDDETDAPPPQSSSPAKEPVKKYGPHPEELAKQASRRMDATNGLAAILRDAAKTPLLRMRSEIYSQARRGRSSITETPAMRSKGRSVLDIPPARGMTVEDGATDSHKRKVDLVFCVADPGGGRE